MNTAIAILPTYSPADVANARAYALAKGENIGTRGRVPNWVLTEWHNALRPVVVKPAERGPDMRGKHTGRRGGPSTVNVDGTKHVVTKREAASARAWAIENDIPVPTKGRLNTATLQAWVNAGMPEHRIERATVYYRALDKKGRPNGKERIGIVYADMLGTGKPRMSDYWHALGIEGIPLRIIAGDMLINVTKDIDGTLEYNWVSKADSKTVVDMLKGNVSLSV